MCGLLFVEHAHPAEEIRKKYDERYFTNYNRIKYGYENYMGHRHLYMDLFIRRMEELEKHRKPGRLLDVGCAAGILMDVARLRGWEVQGVDVSPYASEIARKYYNLDVFTGTLKEAVFDDERFDVIVMHDLIEHVPDPAGLLVEANRILKNEGLLVINTPNAAGFMAKILGKRWFHYKPQTHLTCFSPVTLGAMLDKTGFRMTKTLAAGRVINMEYLMGRLTYDAPLPAKILRIFFYGGPLSKSTFAFWSGEFEAYAEKKD
ncbi:MAG: class I SAM-dependent methyltransferase [bacterium]